MGCNRDIPSEKTRGLFNYLTKLPPTTSFNGQAGVGFLINRKWNDHIVKVNGISVRVAELVLRIAKRCKLNIVQLYSPITAYSEEDINSFYIDVGETSGKQNNNTIVLGDLNAQIGKRTHTVEKATGKVGLELKN